VRDLTEGRDRYGPVGRILDACTRAGLEHAPVLTVGARVVRNKRPEIAFYDPGLEKRHVRLDRVRVQRGQVLKQHRLAVRGVHGRGTGLVRVHARVRQQRHYGLALEGGEFGLEPAVAGSDSGLSDKARPQLAGRVQNVNERARAPREEEERKEHVNHFFFFIHTQA